MEQLALRWKADGSIERCDKYKEAVRERSAEAGQHSDSGEKGIIRMEDVLNVKAKQLAVQDVRGKAKWKRKEGASSKPGKPKDDQTEGADGQQPRFSITIYGEGQQQEDAGE